MTGDGNFKWWWAVGTSDPEAYQGPCDTRNDAIAEARGNDGEEEGFTIIEADKSVPRADIFHADRVLEDYDEYNEDCWGEDGADIRCTKEQEHDLEAMLAATFEAWFKKHGISRAGWCFGTTRNQEYFPPKETPESPR